MRQVDVVGLTREIPWLTLVEIDIDHHRAAPEAPAVVSGDLRRKVVTYQLIIPWVEPESWRQFSLHHAQEAHGAILELERDRESERRKRG